MKIVKENLEPLDFLDFHRSEDSLDNIEIGFHFKIKEWMNENSNLSQDEYRINPDGTIDLLADIALYIKRDIIENIKLPEFIKFRKAYGSFYANENGWESLDGFPEEVMEDFSIFTGFNTKHWLVSDIEKRIKIHGTLCNN